jgi:hypothetical protein
VVLEVIAGFLIMPTVLIGVVVLLLFSVVGPFIGEAVALHALASNRTTSGATTWATVGLATTGIPMLTAPLAGVWAIVSEIFEKDPTG